MTRKKTSKNEHNKLLCIRIAMRCVGTGKKKNHQLGSKEARKDVQILVKKGRLLQDVGGCSSLGWTVGGGGRKQGNA